MHKLFFLKIIAIYCYQGVNIWSIKSLCTAELNFNGAHLEPYETDMMKLTCSTFVKLGQHIGSSYSQHASKVVYKTYWWVSARKS